MGREGGKGERASERERGRERGREGERERENVLLRTCSTHIKLVYNYVSQRLMYNVL